jgi:hypothetical protein
MRSVQHVSMVYYDGQSTNPSWHHGVFPKDVLDFLMRDCIAALVNQFASIVNFLAFSFVVGTNPLAALSVAWCTYLRYIFLLNQAPWTGPFPKILDCG